MKLSIKTTISAVALISLLTGCTPKEAEKTEEQETLYAVTTYKTVASNFDDYLEFGGDVASVSSVDILPDQAGKITNILVNVGDKVSKGQTIAYVNPMRAGMVFQDSPVQSPIAGRITSLPAQVGATVSQGYPVAKVSRTDDLEIRINIAERFVSRIQEKQSATITLDAYPGVEFSAYVSEISPVLDTSSRTMAVKLKLNPADPRVKVGMYAKVKLVTDSAKNAIVVSNTSIVTRDGQTYLFVVNDDKAADGSRTVKLQPVKTGISVDARTEITEGINPGDEIVIKGQTLLNDGARVNVINTSL